MNFSNIAKRFFAGVMSPTGADFLGINRRLRWHKRNVRNDGPHDKVHMSDKGTRAVFGDMRPIGVALILGLASGLATPALSQGLSIPPRQDAQSATGVSYGAGSFTYETRDLSIGGEFPQGLTFDRTYISSIDYSDLGGLGWIHNLSGRISLEPMKVDEGSPLADPRRVPYLYNVSVGGRSVGFVGGSSFPPATGYPQGTYAPIKPTGASLVYTGTNSTDGNYVFTDSDGSVINFHTGGQPRRIQNRIAPDGTRLDFSYDSNVLRSVISNRGYAILIEPPSVPSGTRKICVVNMAQHAVTPASTCPAGAQSVTYSYVAAPSNPSMKLLASATDASGQTTTYGYTGAGTWASLVRLNCITFPGQSTCRIENDYSGCVEYEPTYDRYEMRGSYVTAQRTATGETYSYSYAFTDPTKCVGVFSSDTTQTANGTAVTRVFPNQGSVPNEIRDPLNRATSFAYLSGDTWASEPAELASITYPLGNSVSNFHDARGNVIRQLTRAATGSGLSDLESTAVYPATCGISDRKICNKPLSVTDARANTSNYTYDPAHGGMLTAMQPAPVAGGARPLTVRTYVQKYSYILSGGSLVAASTPVWMPATETECQTAAGSSTPVCDGSAPQKVTTFEYGANGTADNLLLRGVAATAGGITLRTCYGYDAQARKISETKPNANLSVCS